VQIALALASMLHSGVSMRVAIPICRGRISPVFDVARALRVIDIEDRKVTSHDHAITGYDPASILGEHGVNILICAGISREMANRLRAQGFEVISGICGSIDEVVEAYVAGRLDDTRFAMPGGWCLRRCQRRLSDSKGNKWQGGVPSGARSGK